MSIPKVEIFEIPGAQVTFREMRLHIDKCGVRRSRPLTFAKNLGVADDAKNLS